MDADCVVSIEWRQGKLEKEKRRNMGKESKDEEKGKRCRMEICHRKAK